MSPDTSRLVLHDMLFGTPFPGGRPSNLKVAPLLFQIFVLVQRSRAAASPAMFRIMYELAVCSDGMTEAKPRLFLQNRPASGRLRLKMQKIRRVNLVRLNLLKSREIIERH